MQPVMYKDNTMKKGFMLVEVMIAIVMAGVIAAVLATMGYYIMIQSNTLKLQNTKSILDVIRSRLVNSATDPDSDSYFELLKEETNSTVPVVAGLGKDAWGRNIKYTTYDFGIANIINPLYANTNTSISPNTNVLGRLVSLGEDGVLQTDATHTAAQGDDLMIEIGIGEANHLKLYGGSEITTQTRGYNSAIVSSTAPLTPTHGTLWYCDTNATLYMYNATDLNWTVI
jgi:type II secretory pathway pseudopilin PulG